MENKTSRCEFCGALEQDTQLLISGLPPAKPHICDQCVLVCVWIMEEKGITIGWQPIETAPKVGDVLVAGKLADDSWIVGVGRYSLDFGEVCQRGTLATGWTHWMPLPPPPNL